MKDRIKELREALGYKQSELAEKLDVNFTTVSKWEKNVAHPDISLLPKLAQILEVTEHELITASVDNQSREEKKQAKRM